MEQRHTFKSLRQILRELSDAHARLQDIYLRWHHLSHDEREKMLMSQAVRDEIEMRETLQTLLVAEPPDVLDTWLQYYNGEDLAMAMDKLGRAYSAPHSGDRIEAMAHVNRAEEQLYKKARSSTAIERVSELLEQLHVASVNHSQRLSRATNEMMDM